MAYRLSMDKSLSIKALRDTSLSGRAIAESLGVSLNAVRRHLASNPPDDTKAPTGKAPTGSECQTIPRRPPGRGSPGKVWCCRFPGVVANDFAM